MKNCSLFFKKGKDKNMVLPVHSREKTEEAVIKEIYTPVLRRPY